MNLLYDDPTHRDPIYGFCDCCQRVGYEVEGCFDCGALICPFCYHDDCPEED